MRYIHDKKIHAEIRRQAEVEFGRHEVIVENDTGVVRSWRCRAPGTGIFAFRVILSPNTVFVTGDLGDMVLHPHTDDIMLWTRLCLRDPGYVFGKLCQPMVEFDRDLIKSGIDDIEACEREQLDDGEDFPSDVAGALEELRDSHFDSADAFYTAFHDTCLYADSESLPCVERYSSRFLWLLEALRWWRQHMAVVI